MAEITRILGPFKKSFFFIGDQSVESFSLRRVVKNFSGFCIRVRRSSDNSELDVGFNRLDLDTSSLLSFAGANDVFVTKIYGQKEYFNFEQTSTSLQPKIVSSGTLIQDSNGKPAIGFDGTKVMRDDLVSTNVFDFTAGHSMLSRYTVDAAQVYILSSQRDSNSDALWQTFNDNSGNTITHRVFDGTNAAYIGRKSSSSVYTVGQPFINNNYYDGGSTSSSVKIYVDNVQVDSSNNQAGTFVQVRTVQDFDVLLGAQSAGLNNKLNGKFQELIFFESNESSKENTFYNDMNNYWN